jgi:hypothetical protein
MDLLLLLAGAILLAVLSVFVAPVRVAVLLALLLLWALVLLAWSVVALALLVRFWSGPALAYAAPLTFALLALLWWGFVTVLLAAGRRWRAARGAPPDRASDSEAFG